VVGAIVKDLLRKSAKGAIDFWTIAMAGLCCLATTTADSRTTLAAAAAAAAAAHQRWPKLPPPPLPHRALHRPKQRQVLMVVVLVVLVLLLMCGLWSEVQSSVRLVARSEYTMTTTTTAAIMSLPSFADNGPSNDSTEVDHPFLDRRETLEPATSFNASTLLSNGLEPPMNQPPHLQTTTLHSTVKNLTKPQESVALMLAAKRAAAANVVGLLQLPWNTPLLLPPPWNTSTSTSTKNSTLSHTGVDFYAAAGWDRPAAAVQRLDYVHVNVVNSVGSSSSSSSSRNTSVPMEQRPVLAILTSTIASHQHNAPKTPVLVQTLLPSIVATVTANERAAWHVHVYVALDETDAWWRQHWSDEMDRFFEEAVHGTSSSSTTTTMENHTIPEWLSITFGVFPKRPGHIPFNEIALLAYEDGADYLCRVNDDSEFTSSGWITLATTTLQHDMDVPNVGVVAPLCLQGNLNIMTHDLVHRTHMDIFHGYYYPPIFDNWFLDDWMTNVYAQLAAPTLLDGTKSSRILADWHVRHHDAETRYQAHYEKVQWLPYEYMRSRQFLVQYLQTNHLERVLAAAHHGWMERPRRVDRSVTNAVLAALPPQGNVLVWGLDDDGPFWHTSTTGQVTILDQRPSPEISSELSRSHRFISFDAVPYRLRAEDVRSNFQTYVQGQRLKQHESWCDFHVTLPETIWRTHWHVILVSAPQICVRLDNCSDASGPGVFQPLYMSQVIAARQAGRDNPNAANRATTHVFVSHYNRIYEREFSQILFDSKPNHVIHAHDSDQQPANEWAHYIIEPNHRIVQSVEEWCGPHMDFPPSPDRVQWKYPDEKEISLSSLVQSPESWNIVLEVNDGYYDFLLNWLHHYQRLGLAIPVVVIAVDDVVQARVEREVLPTFRNVAVERSSVATVETSAISFDTEGFAGLVSKRPTHIRQKLERGINIIYSDVDTVWRWSPVPYLAALGHGADVIAPVHSLSHNGYRPFYSTGFVALVTNDRTIELMIKWERKLQQPQPNKDWFNILLFKRSGVKHQPLPLKEFPRGETFFFQYSKNQQNATVLVHADVSLDVVEKRRLFASHGLWNVSL
jgi:Nucleotide-diphospho-sugar transferase/Polysaccharide biosynthesis